MNVILERIIFVSRGINVVVGYETVVSRVYDVVLTFNEENVS